MVKIMFVADEELGVFKLYCNGELIDDCSFRLDDPDICRLIINLNQFGEIPIYKEINLSLTED